MVQTLLTYQIPSFDTTDAGFTKITAPRDLQKLPEKLRVVIAKLEGLDIGWLDILTEMANITEQCGDEQLVERLEATALLLKRNRRITRDL